MINLTTSLSPSRGRSKEETKTMKKRVTALLLAVLLISLLTVPASAAETSWLWPVESCTSITPGRDYNGSEHNGIDIPGVYGAEIRASKSGTVDTVYSGCNNHNAYSAGGQTCTSVGCTPNVNTFNGICNDGYGNGVIINHGDGTYSQYAHMSSTTVTVGQQVTQGDVIGYIGNSGALPVHIFIFHWRRRNTRSTITALPSSAMSTQPAHLLSLTHRR